MTDRHHDQSQSGKQVVKKLFFFLMVKMSEKDTHIEG